MEYSLTDHFEFDLTEDQKRLCDWVAQQARRGARQIHYREATAALDLHDEQLTRMLRNMRERLDEIHAMVEAPIVHTRTPYFEVPGQARYIWDSYCRAEREDTGPKTGDRRQRTAPSAVLCPPSSELRLPRSVPGAVPAGTHASAERGWATENEETEHLTSQPYALQYAALSH